MTYLKIGETLYPAKIHDRIRDRSWGLRESKHVTLESTYEETSALFKNDMKWSIVYSDESGGSDDIEQQEVDCSIFSMVGSIGDNLDGTFTVKMGKPLDREITQAIVGQEATIAEARALRTIIETAVVSLDDETAATAPSLFKPWMAGEAVEPGDRRYYTPTGLLYKVREGQGHTTQESWTPDLTPALWAVVGKPDEAGTLEDPITAARGMEYEYGHYYKDPEDSKTYLCQWEGATEGSKIILQYLPHELVGQYFSLA